jgi:Ca2+-binding EF-hand superfamily protein
MGHHMTNDEITTIIQKIDKNGDGLIQFEEFLYMLNDE